MENEAIRLEGLGKIYWTWRSPLRHFLHSLGTSAFGPGHRWTDRLRAGAATAFPALEPLSLGIARGSCVGILGRNGSGKSTLLQLIAGTLAPSSGRAVVRGKVGALLELGCGFNLDFTGRENIRLSAALAGIDPAEIRRQTREILEFAEIGDFVDQPVKTYSSGMFMRLAFAVHAVFAPEVLIIDEALAVGDVFFQQKCTRRLKELRERGTTVLFVSHDLGSVLGLCDRALVLHEGRLLFDGAPEEAATRYLAVAAQRPATPVSVATEEVIETLAADDDRTQLVMDENILAGARGRHGSRELELVAARLVTGSNRRAPVVEMMNAVRFECLVRANVSMHDPQVGLNLYDRAGNEIFSAGTPQLRYALPPMRAGSWLMVEFELSLTVAPGLYTFSLIASETASQGPNSGMFHDVHSGLGPVQVIYDRVDVPPPFNGMVQLPMRFVGHRLVAPPALPSTPHPSPVLVGAA